MVWVLIYSFLHSHGLQEGQELQPKPQEVACDWSNWSCCLPSSYQYCGSPGGTGHGSGPFGSGPMWGRSARGRWERFYSRREAALSLAGYHFICLQCQPSQAPSCIQESAKLVHRRDDTGFLSCLPADFLVRDGTHYSFFLSQLSPCFLPLATENIVTAAHSLQI